MTNQINKSFILHKDSLSILDQLTDEQAGKLFKAIYSYQKTGKIGNLDQITKIIITPFINQFKRDKESYNNSVAQGKIGNLKKYHNDIYLRLINGELNLEEAENLAYPHKKVIHRPPIIPDQDGSLSDNDNDNDNDNKNKNDKELINSQFEEFWKSYKPIHTGLGVKKEAKECFIKALNKDTFENITKGLKAYMSDCHSKGTYTKQVAGWLKKEMWKGEYLTTESNNLAEEVNSLIKQDLILKIEKNGSTAKLYFKNEKDFEILKTHKKKEEVKELITKELSITNFEFSF